MRKPRKVSAQNDIADFKELDFVELVDIARKSRNKEKTDAAFSEIESRMKNKIAQISRKFRIPGYGFDDIYADALFALRYKAIKDYDQSRGSGEGPYPFDRFAILCIRRHLSTKLKSSYQNKQIVLNRSLSLDQERSDNEGEMLFLSDIVEGPNYFTAYSVEDKDYYKKLLRQLYDRLSSLEKKVLFLYLKQYSYEEISEEINVHKKPKQKKVNVKSVDNARSRIKNKAVKIFTKNEKQQENIDRDTRGKKKRK